MSNNKKCGHHINYDNTTCFTLKAVQQMSNDYNKALQNNILKGIPIDSNLIKNGSKNDLFKQLSNRMEKFCQNDHKCFTDQSFMSNKNFLKHHFKPQGTQHRRDWLSTIEINELMHQMELKHKYFLFGGAIPRDVLKIDYPLMNRNHYIRNLQLGDLRKLKKPIIAYVYNLDEHWQSGSHWVALYCNIVKKQIYFFDSYGIRPHKDIRKMVRIFANFIHQYHNKKCNYDCSEEEEDSFMKNNKKNNLEKKLGGNIEWNRNRHQYKNTECGVYSCHFIIKLLEGKTFESLSNNRIPDDDINKFRDVFWLH